MASVPTRDAGTTVRTTCPRDCYDACGIIVHVDGTKVRVAGDPQHPVSRGHLCGKCSSAYNGPWLDRSARLSEPLIRTGPKGKGSFRTATWDEALDRCATHLRPLLDAGHGSKILHTHYTGTVSLLAGGYPMRFFHAVGATEVDPDTVCNKAGHVALDYVLGTSTWGFDPRWIDQAATVVVWGANPSAAAPHTHRHWLRRATGTTIVIDPLRHATAEAADIHLALRPGSDAALAFGLLHVAWRDGLLDTDVLEHHSTGWPELLPDVEAATPAITSERTGVPAELIDEVGRRYAAGPSLLWLGQGMQRQPMGGNAFRAAAALAVATGNTTRPASGIYYLNGAETRGIDGDVVTRPDLAPGPIPSISHMDLAAALATPDRFAALVTWNNNIVASNPQQEALRAGLGREDLFHLAVELFATDTVDYADVVLPAASFLEFDDIVASYFDWSVSPQVAAVPAPGSAVPNQEVFRRLASALGLDHPALHEPDRPILDRLLAGCGSGLDFASLAAAGTVGPVDPPSVQFPGGRFPTPSGRAELASGRAEADGHPRTPFPHFDEAPPDGWLRVLSPASPRRMNSTYGNDPLGDRAEPAPEVWLHPGEAAARGVGEGDPVELYNPTGCLPVTVRLSDGVPTSVALVYKGRWPKRERSGVNVNILNPGVPTDMGESSSVHGVHAQLRPASEPSELRRDWPEPTSGTGPG